MDNNHACESKSDKSGGPRFAVKLAVRAEPDAASQQQRRENYFYGPVERHSVDSCSIQGALKLVGALTPLCNHVGDWNGVILLRVRA